MHHQNFKDFSEKKALFIKQNEELFKERQREVSAFLNSNMWIKWLKPFIEKKASRYSNIRMVSTKDQFSINRDFFINTGKVEICRDIINCIENTWIKQPCQNKE